MCPNGQAWHGGCVLGPWCWCRLDNAMCGQEEEQEEIISAPYLSLPNILYFDIQGLIGINTFFIK